MTAVLSAQMGNMVAYEGKAGTMRVYVNVRDQLRNVDRYGQEQPVRLSDLEAYAEAVTKLAANK